VFFSPHLRNGLDYSVQTMVQTLLADRYHGWENGVNRILRNSAWAWWRKEVNFMTSHSVHCWRISLKFLQDLRKGCGNFVLEFG